MKYVFLIIPFFLSSCHPNENKNVSIEKTYTPGFGEFMSSIQTHHAKLWFAGLNKNWKLATFEIAEIKETIENIKRYETDREESKNIDMVAPAMDSVTNAIQQKNTMLFKRGFILLTNTCNKCHSISNFEFNKVKVPEVNSFYNQEFIVK